MWKSQHPDSAQQGDNILQLNQLRA